jgi:hypothetical protein
MQASPFRGGDLGSAQQKPSEPLFRPHREALPGIRYRFYFRGLTFTPYSMWLGEGQERRTRVHTVGSHGSARAHAGTRLPAGRARALPYRRYASSV